MLERSTVKKNFLTVLFLVSSFGFAACKPAQAPQKTATPPATGATAPSAPSGSVPVAKPAAGGGSSVHSSSTTSDSASGSDEELDEEFKDESSVEKDDGFPAYNKEDFDSPQVKKGSKPAVEKKSTQVQSKGKKSSAGSTQKSPNTPNTNDVNLAQAQLLSEAEAHQSLMILLEQVRPEILQDLMTYYRANQKWIESEDPETALYYGERFTAKRAEILDSWSEQLAQGRYVPIHLVDYFWKEVLEKDQDLSLEWVRVLGLSEVSSTAPSDGEEEVVIDEAEKAPAPVPAPAPAPNSTPDPIIPPAPTLVSDTSPTDSVEEDLEKDTPESIEALKIEVAGLLGVQVEKIQTWPVEKLKVTRARLTAMKVTEKTSTDTVK